MNVNENCGASLLMLGTGHATVTECYNTCFVLSVGRDRLLVDGGGGNGILTQFRKAGIGFGDLSAIFVTHAHTDHILGVVWALRMVCVHAFANPDFRIKVYGNSKCIGVLEYLCANLLAENYRAVLARAATFVTVADGDIVGVGEALSLRVFDMRSANEPQMGFSAQLPSGGNVVCLGDEPYVPHLAPYVEGARWLLCEAFCLDRDEARFGAHHKHHGTVREAAAVAEALHVENLVLYHTEDTCLPERKEAYTSEARGVFSGNVFVPDDLEAICLEGWTTPR